MSALLNTSEFARDGEQRPSWWSRRCGVDNGKGWHLLRVGEHRHGRRWVRLTLCRKVVAADWSPGWRNSRPTLCSTCEGIDSGRLCSICSHDLSRRHNELGNCTVGECPCDGTSHSERAHFLP